MPTLEQQLRTDFGYEFAEQNMHRVGDVLREIVANDGLGVALLVAHCHGLEIGHIPLEKDKDGTVLSEQCRTICTADDQYVFAHVPVRKYRGDHQALIRLGIMNDKADPVDLLSRGRTH